MRFSDDEIRRYARQMVLREVGGVGQQRLRAATATAHSELEALYLAAAGVGCVRVPSDAIAAAVRALNPLVRVEVAAGASGVIDSPVVNPVFDSPVDHSEAARVIDPSVDNGVIDSPVESSAMRALRFIREAIRP